MSATIPPSVPGEPGAQPGRGAGVPPVPVPAELACVPPGALLAGLLEDIDVEHVSGHDTVEVLCAQYRQLCRQQARFYQAVLETGLRKPFSINTVERVVHPGEFGAEEARAALAWSRARAERALSFAIELFLRLPLLGEAMLAGELDEPRARAFVDWTGGLTDEQAHQVCQHLLPAAPGLMVGELIDRIKRACLAIDSAWSEKRYREAVRSRRVVGSRNPDGTANLGGYQQPVDRIAAASERIDALARTCKRAGDTRPIDHIRSDLFIGMTDGTFEALTDTQVVEYVLAHPYTESTDGDEDQGGKGGGQPGPDGGGEPCDGDEPRDGAGGAAGTPPAAALAGPITEAPSAIPPAQALSAIPPAQAPSGSPPTDVPAVAERTTAPPVVMSWAVPEVRVELATVLEVNEHPGEIPLWGCVPASLARRLVAAMHSAEWGYVFCDADGRAMGGGLIGSRPSTTSGRRVRRDVRRGGIVELAVPAAELGRLTAGQPREGPWAPVLVELARHAERASRGLDNDTRDADRRTARATLRRWVQQRDRQCVHPCCRAPARSADQDHRIGFASGGPTIGVNLSAPCRHDHRLKDEGHWTIDQPEPGLTVWTSPLARRYESRPPPVITRVPEPHSDQDNRWEPPAAYLAWDTRPPVCDCDTACDCDRPILPPVPRRVPADEPANGPEATPVFDPEDKPPF